MATRQGMVKKTELEAFSRPRTDGIIAIAFAEGDKLVEASLTDGQAHVLLASSGGRVVRFEESDVRPTGRNTRGVRGISLKNGEELVGMVTVASQASVWILTLSAQGYGKRTALADYPVQRRGGQGVWTMKLTPRTGRLMAIKAVQDSDDLMLITHNGQMIRLHVGQISCMGRHTQGVRLIQLRPGDAIADVTRLITETQEDEAVTKEVETPEHPIA